MEFSENRNYQYATPYLEGTDAMPEPMFNQQYKQFTFPQSQRPQMPGQMMPPGLGAGPMPQMPGQMPQMPQMPGQMPQMPQMPGSMMPPGLGSGQMPPMTNQDQTGQFEESYIENILRLNKGKVGTFYFSYTDSKEWKDKVYRGVIEAAGKDHIIISDLRDGKRYLLELIYLNWAEFDGEINYEYPISSSAPRY